MILLVLPHVFRDSTPGAAQELSASNGPGKLPGRWGVVGGWWWMVGGGWWMRSWWNLPPNWNGSWGSWSWGKAVGWEGSR